MAICRCGEVVLGGQVCELPHKLSPAQLSCVHARVAGQRLLHLPIALGAGGFPGLHAARASLDHHRGIRQDNHTQAVTLASKAPDTSIDDDLEFGSRVGEALAL
mmetsp:Transcript_29896/g.80346  ORF Transcript_29896/g.80346 Transcript_29896/m.80346 type:complete len:104 (-) Transcript_29896:572-883(-)